jgi:superfamily II DNA or RNA helicase
MKNILGAAHSIFHTTFPSRLLRKSWTISVGSTNSPKVPCDDWLTTRIATSSSSIGVRKAVDDGPVLLFANSVEHAQHLTARLCLSGVPSASIYADTDVAVRQYFIRQFLEGRIQVLSNYLVLATGFDAPKTATIVISRPVFSPVRYMQMVGRGLRGPKNGGTATCKIITVVDNLVQYGDRLAYHYFMRHYS